MKKKKDYLVVVAISVVILVITVMANQNEDYIKFAKCLTNENVTLYGVSTCPHCKNQKEIFGEAFKYITYVECDTTPKLCNGINVVPTWIFNNINSKVEGALTIEQLSLITGCKVE